MLLIILIAAVILLVLLISHYTYRRCFYAAARPVENIEKVPSGEQYQAVKERLVEISRIMEHACCDRVTITAWDGTKLSGRYYSVRAGAPVMLLFHGYRSMALRDSAGGFALAHKLDMNVMAVDQRSHGRSGGHVITFGVKERFDCLSWIEYISTRFGASTPIVLSGLSMGAATVLMATELNLPGNVVCVMADCPYSSPSEIIRKVCIDEHFPADLCAPFIRLGARVFGHFNLEEAAAVTAVEKAGIPIILFHGEDDRFVPCDMSRQIYEHCGCRAELHTFPHAGHGLCYISDPRRYERLCVEFLLSIPQLQPHLASSEFVKSVMK